MSLQAQLQITIYILLCSDGTYYTGITKDLARRLKEHNRGKASYTKDKLPVSPVFLEVVNGYKVAAMIERKIKNYGARRYMSKFRNYNQLKT